MTPDDIEPPAFPDEDMSAGSSAGGDEPEPQPPDEEPAAESASAPDDSAEPEPLALEEEEPADTGEPAAGDVDACPNCGEPWRDSSSLICLRCGYDLKSLSVIETETDETKGAPIAAGEAREERPPLVRSGMGDHWLPVALAALGAVVLVIGYLAGASGLFPQLKFGLEEDAAIPVAEWPLRLAALGRFPALILLWTICGFGAIVACAQLFGRALGDLKLAMLRMLGIVVAARTVAFIDLRWPIVEFLAQSAAAAVIFLLLSMLLFRLRPRDAGSLLAITIVSFVVLYVLSLIVMWVTT